MVIVLELPGTPPLTNYIELLGWNSNELKFVVGLVDFFSERHSNAQLLTSAALILGKFTLHRNLFDILES